MEWKTIQHNQSYEVSDAGHIRNKQTGRILAPSENGHGLLKVNLYGEEGPETWTVSRLVADAFLEPPHEGEVIFYIDDDRHNVAASNITWKPRWFAQEWQHQLKRTTPMRRIKIMVHSRVTEQSYIYEDSLQCALRTYGIEKYIVLACGRGSIYNHATYEWLYKERV